ncbi:hypothetical protein B5C26_21790 [Photorhabdus luminescens]|uniref:Uncharacterized protein n=1 Tax=Photorhabdus luminescens subsp. mexicana TaxID=2100167 RepID=A0A4R4J533_PHOLU|nr:hypothetical protein B5C26_21790 [Photorhabdus luminescens]TDB48700.1 hypothetical protein C5468_15040 [Photorhabdus luminescens subsp. mexicana]
MITLFRPDCLGLLRALLNLDDYFLHRVIRAGHHYRLHLYIPVIFQVASLLAALTHPGHIVIYAPGDSLPCRRDAS